MLRGREDGSCDHDVIRVTFPEQASVARYALIHGAHAHTNKLDALRALSNAGNDVSMADAEIPQIGLDDLTFFG